MDVGVASFAVGGCAWVEPVGVALDPHAVTVSSAAAAKHPSRTKPARPPSPELIFLTSPYCRERTCGLPSRPASPAGPETAGRRPRRPYSGVQRLAARL